MIQPHPRAGGGEPPQTLPFLIFFGGLGVFLITSKMVLFLFPPMWGSKMKIGIQRTLQDKQESFGFEAHI